MKHSLIAYLLLFWPVLLFIGKFFSSWSVSFGNGWQKWWILQNRIEIISKKFLQIFCTQADRKSLNAIKIKFFILKTHIFIFWSKGNNRKLISLQHRFRLSPWSRFVFILGTFGFTWKMYCSLVCSLTIWRRIRFLNESLKISSKSSFQWVFRQALAVQE